MTDEQHDDHIWLTVGGKAWAIWSLRWPIIYLWRGFEPNLEFTAIDVSAVDWDSYYEQWLDMGLPSPPGIRNYT